MKILTVIVPCYNSEQYMRKCVESLLAGGNRVEIIIINDGSTDGTGVIADEYAKEFPKVVKVVHQENGGHGEGINQGLRLASGRYFKVVDSDDWVGENELKAVIKRLEEAERENGVDMLITNYVYEHHIKEKNRTIRYRNIFPTNRVIGWEDTRPFLEHQYLTIHSVVYNTQLLRSCKLELPKHTFYEDNLFIYKPLPFVRKMIYMDVDFYHYQIGREGQSVAEQSLKYRFDHQIKIALQIFSSHDLRSVKKEAPKLGRYMYHEAKMMLIMATAFARLNNTQESEERVRELWDQVVQRDALLGKRIRYFSEASLLNKPGKLGRVTCVTLYRFAHKAIKFN